MPRGGKRAGAGRKKGKANKKTQEVVARAEAGGIMPVDLLLFVMRERFAAGDYKTAAELAKDAAPYTSARLSAVVLKGDESAPVRIEFDGGWYLKPAEESPPPALPDGASAASAALPGPV